MDNSIHNLRDALEWLDRRIREEAELDGEMSNDHAIQLGFITNMLEKFPLRQCDVGTAEEQAQRYDKFCEGMDCVKCPVHALWHHYFEICKNQKVSCGLIWAQMPYESEVKE